MKITTSVLIFFSFFFISSIKAETKLIKSKSYVFEVSCEFFQNKNFFSLNVSEYNPKHKKYEIFKSGTDVKVVGLGEDDKVIYEKNLNFLSKKETDAIYEKYEGGLLSESENHDEQTLLFFFETTEKLKKLKIYYLGKLVSETTNIKYRN